MHLHIRFWCRVNGLKAKLHRVPPIAYGRYGSKSRISRLFAEMIMLRSLAAISRRKTLPLSVITPSIWPRGARLIGRYGCTCALIKWESARFHEVGNGIALGLIWGSCPTLYSPLLFSFSHSPWSFLPHENAVTPYSGWCEIPRRHWFAWVERFIVYAPIKHSIWLHPLTHRELTSTRIRLSLSLSLSLTLLFLSFDWST